MQWSSQGWHPHSHPCLRSCGSLATLPDENGPDASLPPYLKLSCGKDLSLTTNLEGNGPRGSPGNSSLGWHPKKSHPSCTGVGRCYSSLGFMIQHCSECLLALSPLFYFIHLFGGFLWQSHLITRAVFLPPPDRKSFSLLNFFLNRHYCKYLIGYFICTVSLGDKKNPHTKWPAQW